MVLNIFVHCQLELEVLTASVAVPKRAPIRKCEHGKQD